MKVGIITMLVLIALLAAFIIPAIFKTNVTVNK